MIAERVDWLHLLPTPRDGWRKLVVLDAPPEARDRIVGTGLAHIVSFDPTDLAGADAVAVLGHELAESSVPLIAEWAPDAEAVLVVSTRRRGRRTTGRALRRLGLETVAKHWPVPAWDRPRRFVPLDHPGALRWYVDHLLVDGSVAARAGGRLLTASARVAPGVAAALVPTVVVVATRVPAGRERSLVLTSGNDRWSRTVVCEFGPVDASPRSIVKAPTEPSGNDVVVLEQRTLRTLRDALTPEMRATVPEPLGHEQRGALVVGRESAVDGTPLSVSSARGDRDEAMDDLAAATRWVRRLAQDTAVVVPWEPAWFDDWIAAPAAVHHERFGHDARLDTLVDALRGPADALDGTVVPHGWVHHDLGPWNVLRRTDGVGVVDWEAARGPDPSATPPLTDLVYLGTYWLHVAGGFHDEIAHREAARRLWTDVGASDPLVLAVRRSLAAAVDGGMVDGAGVPPAVVPMAIVHTWLDQANRVVARRAALGTDHPTEQIHAQDVLEVLCGDPQAVLAVASSIAGT